MAAQRPHGSPATTTGDDARGLLLIGGSPRPPFPFIVARGRSGTTLLRAMFDSHRAMAIPPEAHFVVALGRQRRRFEQPGGFDVDAFVGDLASRYGFRRWELDPEEVRARLRSQMPADVASAIRSVFSMFAESKGKTRYAEKTPINVMHIPFLAGLFPEARFIHLIRDGRDVALSYLDADFGVDSLHEAAIYWRRFVREGRASGRRLGPDRYREVRYERLMEDPEGVLRSLCAFVDLQYDPGMLRYHERAGELMPTLSHREHHTRIALPPIAGLRDWRRDMSPGDEELFEALAGDLLSELGYERRLTGFPLRIRWEASRARTGVLARRALRRLGKLRARVTQRAVSTQVGTRRHVGTPRIEEQQGT